MLEPWLETTESIARTAALALGACVALGGLSTWKKQLRGKTEYDLSRRLMRAVLETRDAVAIFRSPAISPGETREAMMEAGVDASLPNQAGIVRADGLVYQRRWTRVAKALSDLHVEVLEAEVLWQKEPREAEFKLLEGTQALWAAMVMYFSVREPDGQKTQQQRQLEESWFQALNARASTPDTYAEAVDSAVRRFEALVQPHLRI